MELPNRRSIFLGKSDSQIFILEGQGTRSDCLKACIVVHSMRHTSKGLSCRRSMDVELYERRTF